MKNFITKSDSSQPVGETAVYLFDDWFDPIEARVRDRVRGFIQAMIEGELDETLMRPRYGRRLASSSGKDDGLAAITGHRHRHRSRSLTGSFGWTEIAVPWRKPAIACSALRACRRANGEAREQRTRSNVYTKSSNGESKRRPCCHRQIRRRCCSGRCSPPVRSTCAGSMAGRPWRQSLSIRQLTSLLDRVLSKCRRSRHTEFQHNSRRHHGLFVARL